MDPKRTLYMSVKSQNGYGIEYLNAEQTRDTLPGVESFVMQSMKTVFRCAFAILMLIFRNYNKKSLLIWALALNYIQNLLQI